MNSPRRSLNLPTVVMTALLVSVLAYQAGANRAAAPQAVSARVATVDLSAVLDGLKQRGEAEAELAAIQGEIIAEQERRQAELQRLDEQRQNITDPMQRQQIEEEIALTALKFQGWLRHANQRLDIEQVILMQDLYRAISQAIDKLAAAEGYDLVISDDSARQFVVNPESQVSRLAQVEAQINARNVLHAGNAVNITDDLITRMNNAFAAGQTP